MPRFHDGNILHLVPVQNVITFHHLSSFHQYYSTLWISIWMFIDPKNIKEYCICNENMGPHRSAWILTFDKSANKDSRRQSEKWAS